MGSPQPIIVSAPGKIYLLGEHSVVYGRPALIAAIDRRLYVEIKKNKKTEINTSENTKLVWETVKVFQKNFSVDKLPPCEITITSQIPTGSGLGSSAALSAALLGALMKFVKNLWNPNKINELAYEVEKKAHGNPSGADNTAVVFGGLVWYRREFDFLRSIWNLPVTSYKIPKFVLIDSGRPAETTKDMVESVALLYTKKRKETEEIFADQETQTKKLLLSLKFGDYKSLVFTIKKGENNLEKMGVVGEFAQKIIKGIELAGGAAKVCGAGGKKDGSGILLCYHDDLTKIKQIAEKFKAGFSAVKLGEEGIRIEK